MKIGLCQVDGKLPNLAIMKIAAFHKSKGDEVGWWLGPLFEYDKVYVSKIFKFSQLPALPENAIVGGTGISFSDRLPKEIDEQKPGDAWWLYPDYKNHLGFSESGCRFECSFCCVPQKDGKPKGVSNIKDLITNPKGEDRLVLLDDDFFGQSDWESRCDEIINLKLQVCFAQGVNIRVLTEKQAEYLSRLKFRNLSFKLKQITFAWDQFKDKKLIDRGIERLVRVGIKPYRMQFFVLIGYDTTKSQDMERVLYLKDRGCDPYVMAYDRSDDYQRKFQRWVNHRAIFKTVSFDKYNSSAGASWRHKTLERKT